MEFKKCARCGCFFVSEAEVCPKCLPKDRCDISKLTNYINDNNITASTISNLSVNTGITLKNINRYLDSDIIPKVNL
ncbi:MAG: hypothetical protein HFJ19_02545 [Clostridia bacterium]|nr:hypothetical protein [Clostridia bacterium]